MIGPAVERVAEPRFLTLDHVLELHRQQLARYGGSPGIRDDGLLHSALAQPEASFSGRWLHADLSHMAAAYAFHLAENHPFVDGNKRIGLATALVFLGMNGLRLEMEPRALAQVVLDVASGRAGKADIADAFRIHVRPLLG